MAPGGEEQSNGKELDHHIPIDGGGMTFQDMVSATNGVLNYVADELNEKTGIGRVEQVQNCNDSRVLVDLERCPVDHDSSVEAASSSFW